MSDINSLQGRITAALDRIGAGVSQLNKVSPQAESTAVAEAAALRGQLEEERSANAQLEERVRVLKERQDGNIAKLEKRVETQAATLAGLDAELQRLRASNAELRELNAQLRSAASDGATSPELINRATIAEVEALAAQRATDVAEIDAIITELKPLIEEA